MKKAQALALLAAGGCMALIWRFATVNYIALALFQRAFPLPEAMATLWLAALITAITRNRGWRVIGVIGLQVSGLALMILRTVYVLNSWNSSFWSRHWVVELITTPRNAVQWLAMVLVAGLVVLFWYGGWFLVRGRQAPQSVYSRFDLGLAAFFMLFLAKFLVRQKAQIVIQDPWSEMLLVSFLLFGLLAIGLTRHQGAVRKEFMSGYKTVGMMLSAIALVLLFGMGLVVLFWPYLTTAAQVGYTVLKTVSAPVGALLMGMVRFLLIPRSQREQGPAEPLFPEAGPSADLPESGGWIDLINQIIGYGAVGVGGVVVLAVVVVMLWMLVQWLWSRTAGSGKSQIGINQSIWLAFWAVVVRALRTIRATAGTIFHASPQMGRHYFKALLTWGRRSGMPRMIGETPLEYGLRLKIRFPRVGREIGTIVDLFNQDIYGGMPLDGQGLETVRAAWRKVRSPLYWGQRMRAWFVRQ